MSAGAAVTATAYPRLVLGVGADNAVHQAPTLADFGSGSIVPAGVLEVVAPADMETCARRCDRDATLDDLRPADHEHHRARSGSCDAGAAEHPAQRRVALALLLEIDLRLAPLARVAVELV